MSRQMYAQTLIPVPQSEREALRWTLVVVPPCVVLGLALGRLYGRWRAARCGD